MADLDETTWTLAEYPDRLELLGNYVVQIVDERLYQKNDIAAVNLPILGSFIGSINELKDLELSPRIENRIIRGNHIGDQSWFLTATAAELLSIIGFGSRSLLELSTALEIKGRHTPAKGGSNPATSNNGGPNTAINENSVVLRARIILEDFPLEEIASKDPRFRFLKLRGKTLHELLGYLTMATKTKQKSKKSKRVTFKHNNKFISRDIGACSPYLILVITPSSHHRFCVRVCVRGVIGVWAYI
jgi:hypothetical protein